MKKTKKNNIDIKAVAKANDNFSLLMGHDSLLDRAYPLRKTGDYLKAAKGWVYACTNVIAEEVAGIELKLFEVKKNKVEEVQEHDALDLLYRANNFTTKFDLFYATQQMLELA
ncbi:MAG: phage portal protein, partial [Gammaproteobacteria bacterium]|nr:phage portal protein [Gammaproteobacteria bacterium]